MRTFALASAVLLIVGSGERFCEEFSESYSETSTGKRDNVTNRDPISQSYSSDDPLLIKTKCGAVRGTYSDGVRVFHGVPYAKPPIGDLRWQPPVETSPWYPEVFDARKIRPGCPQDCSVSIYCTNATSEDCLFLEIYAPAKVTSLVPVLVYIHGGGFQSVTATLPVYDASKFVKRSGTIVVLMEYRLGVLGFLVTGTGKDQATGNYGILDQRLALKWVKDNIKSFGGDPDRVTLAGQSAGAQSALIHLVSEESSLYFDSLILESMPFSLPYQTSKVASGHGKTFAQILNCLGQSSKVNMACLRTKTATEIIDAQKKSVEKDFNGINRLEPYAPVIDGDLLKMQTLDALKQYGETSKQIKPMIWGYTTEEALFFVSLLLPEPLNWMLTKFVVAMFVGDLADEVEEYYPFDGKNDTREEISRALSDFIFRCPLVYLMKLLAETGQSKGVWLYNWDRPVDIGYTQQLAMCNGRVCHSTELLFVFQTFSSYLNVTKVQDIQLSNSIIDYYSNFVHHGNPNGDTKEKPNGDKKPVPEIPEGPHALIDWPSVSTHKDKGISRLIFSRDGSLKTVSDMTDKYCDFWDKTGYSIFSMKGKNK